MTEPLDSEVMGETGGVAAKPGLPKRLRGTSVAQDNPPSAAVERKDPARQARAQERAIACARMIDANKGRDILVLDLRPLTSIVDYFVIATVASRRQANASAIEIDATMKREQEFKLGIEGQEEGRWVLVDYGDFVVHIFAEEAREYYRLEEIWADAPRVDWEESRPDRAGNAGTGFESRSRQPED